MTSAISAVGLGRDYGRTTALGRLDLEVAPGALVGLLGPNGAGKTTTMLLLATLLAPTRGHAALFGHDLLTARAAARRTLGLVFQETTVDGLLTVEENLRFAGRLQGLEGERLATAVHDALQRTGLHAQRAVRTARLSGGWRRLADVARATLHHPQLLILDEPTVGLDPEHRELLWRFLADERRTRGTTILFSTHYLTEAEPADRVLLLARGAAVADGTPAALQHAIGITVVEVEGPGADAALQRFTLAGLVTSVITREHGLHLGLGLDAAAASHQLGDFPALTRRVVRAPTLDDAYFAATRAVAASGAAA